MKGIKLELHEVLEKAEDDNLLSRSIDGFLLALIVSNIAVVILESIASLRESYGGFFEDFELISVIIFSVEYVLRLWVCNVLPQYRGALGRIKYALTPMAIVDLMAVLPFYLPLFFTFDPSGPSSPFWGSDCSPCPPEFSDPDSSWRCEDRRAANSTARIAAKRSPDNLSSGDHSVI